MLKSHVSAPFVATIQCFTQKQVDKNIYVYKTHTFFWWVEICIYIYIYIHTSDVHYISISIYFIQVLLALFPANCNGRPPLGTGQCGVGCVAFAGESGSRCSGPERREMGCFFLGLGKTIIHNFQKKRAKGTLSIGIMSQGLGRLFFFL